LLLVRNMLQKTCEDWPNTPKIEICKDLEQAIAVSSQRWVLRFRLHHLISRRCASISSVELEQVLKRFPMSCRPELQSERSAASARLSGHSFGSSATVLHLV
jgi:hypothetical protein